MQVLIVMVAVQLTIAACIILLLALCCCACAYAQRYAVQVVPRRVPALAPSQESRAGRCGPAQCTIESSPALALAAQGRWITLGRRRRSRVVLSVQESRGTSESAIGSETTRQSLIGSFEGIQEENYRGASQLV